MSIVVHTGRRGMGKLFLQEWERTLADLWELPTTLCAGGGLHLWCACMWQPCIAHHLKQQGSPLQADLRMCLIWRTWAPHKPYTLSVFARFPGFHTPMECAANAYANYIALYEKGNIEQGGPVVWLSIRQFVLIYSPSTTIRFFRTKAWEVETGELA